MRTLILGLSLLAAIVPASATIEIFFTSSNEPYGLTDPNLAFMPTLDIPSSSSTGADYQSYALQSPTDAPEFRAVTYYTPGEWLYIWLRFDNEPNGKTVPGLELTVSSIYDVADIACYVMDNEGLDGANERRWSGVAPDQFWQYWANPVILAAITTNGIRNTDAGSMVHDPLYIGSERAALLGAVRPLPTTTMLQIEASDGIHIIDPWPPPYTCGSAVLVPEPAGLAAIVIVALGFGRRRPTWFVN